MNSNITKERSGIGEINTRVMETVIDRRNYLIIARKQVYYIYYRGKQNLKRSFIRKTG